METLLKQIQQWSGCELRCECPDEVHRVATRRVVLEHGAIGRIAEFMEPLDLPSPVLVVTDDHTLAAAGDAVLSALSESGREMHHLNFGPSAEVEDSFVAQVKRAATEIGGDLLPVAVGAGTINDVVKMAAQELGVPYVVCATAPSMNGYPSAISAIFRGGVKRTLSARPPVAIIADLDVMQAAPVDLIASGFADLLSKPLCNSDWWLAHRLQGEPYCTVPVAIMLDAVERIADQGDRVKARDPEAIALLTGALILSGFAMAAAGHSRPASGAEHLISHYWDMMGHRDGWALDLHGRQVGVGCLLALKAWGWMLSLGANDIRERAGDGDAGLSAHLGVIRAAYGSLAPGVEEEFGKKWLRPDERRAQLMSLADIWDDLREELAAALPVEGVHRRRLEAVGAPTQPEHVGRTAEEASAAVTYARYIRARYTILDLVADLGGMDEVL